MATTSSNRKNACFIHSTHMDIWKDELLIGMLDKIITSGLIEKLEFVFINNIGTPLDIDKLQKKHPKFIVENYSRDLNLFENVTIRTLHQFARLHTDYNILYLHTKGVSHEKISKFIPGIMSWNRYMMYGCVQKHHECIKLLNMYDTVGCNYKIDTNPQHYSGNYWWATSAYVATLSVHWLADKYDAEFWLLRNNPKWYNLHTLQHLYQIEYPIENYASLIDQKFSENLLYCQFGSADIGLCNQLNSLVNTIVLAKYTPGFTTVIVNDFMKDLDTNVYCTAAEMIDFEKMNEWLLPHNVRLICKHAVELQIEKISFGRKPYVEVDITEPLVSEFFHDHCLHIPQGTHLVPYSVQGDPMPHQLKQIYIEYRVNGRLYKEHFDEYAMMMESDLCLDFRNFRNAQWLSPTSITDARSNVEFFNDCLRHVAFRPFFHELIQPLLSQVQGTMNVMHLRLENDAIDFWSHINKLPNELYLSLLEQKYIRIIQTHLDPASTTVLLSGSTENAVTKYMDNQGYKYVMMDKTLVQGRETNAILDYLISTHCNGVFVGNVNPHNYHGSTFSYAILNSLRNVEHVKKVCIDTDRIFDNEYIL